MSYIHLSLKERHDIEIERKVGTSMNQIAKALERSQSGLSREVNRNTEHRGYRHKQANRLAEQRHKNKPYRKRYGSAHNRTGISNRVDIEQHPEEHGLWGDWYHLSFLTPLECLLLK